MEKVCFTPQLLEEERGARRNTVPHHTIDIPRGSGDIPNQAQTIYTLARQGFELRRVVSFEDILYRLSCSAVVSKIHIL